MAEEPAEIGSVGLVASVGMCAPAACAAIRAGLTNHTATRFLDSSGDWIVGGQVPLAASPRGLVKLVEMLRLAVEECLARLEIDERGAIPLILGVAEEDRPGRIDGLEKHLIGALERRLALRFDPQHSRVIPQGRVSLVPALVVAKRLLAVTSVPHILIACVDSLLVGPTLARFDADRRLLTKHNSNGLIPGEAAGALLVQRDAGVGPRLMCEGVGLAHEPCTIYSEEPLRADGLTAAIKLALADAACEMHDIDFRVTDLSGEQYYFKEATLALTRTLRRRKETFDIWHPAECVGDVGAAAGAVMAVVAYMACAKAYAVGPRILLHAGNDTGTRGAVVLRYRDA